MTDTQLTIEPEVLNAAYQAWMLRLAFPTAAAVDIAQAIKSVYSSFNAGEMALMIRYGAPTPVYPDMGALELGTLLLSPSLYPDTTAEQMRTTLQSAGFELNEIRQVIDQLYEQPNIIYPPTGLKLTCNGSSRALDLTWEAVTLPAKMQDKTPTYNVALFTINDQQHAISTYDNVQETSTSFYDNSSRLRTNEQYVAKVQTVVESYQSDWSETSAPATYYVFSAPRNFKYLVNDPNTIILSWDPFTEVEQMDIYIFDTETIKTETIKPISPQPPVYFNGGNEVKVDLSFLPPEAITSFLVRGLFRVSTSSELVPGPWSDPVVFTRRPQQPQNLAYTCSYATNECQVTWHTDKPGITEYLIQLLGTNNSVIWEKRTSQQAITIPLNKDTINANRLQVAAICYRPQSAFTQIAFTPVQPANWYQATKQSGLQNMNKLVALNHDGKMWAYAGQYQNSVYCSSDGVSWECVTKEAPWIGRRSSAGVSFMEGMWLFGGDTVKGAANDVWVSSDGINWKCTTPNSSWQPRFGHCAVVFNKMMWIFGGMDHKGNVYNDVWVSSDGSKWIEITPNAGWKPRDSAAAVVHQDKIVLMGGSNSGKSLDDVWATFDGKSWWNVTHGQWISRFDAKAVSFANKLYLIGGTNSEMREVNDMWVTQNGSQWQLVTQKAPWAGRCQQGVVLFKEKIYMYGGINSYNLYQEDQSVWYYTLW
ncbi:Kelch repeat-containing protein [Paenibacillus xylaniclasticus]|uniref:Kelch repeat-containing protein n=1 Tax=Paenibacillus xylaniclasticus TaxID=588083 RepID=UPI000FDBA1AF|nr:MULTISPECIES: hypothetical protein [Paenibacillus]GFN32237.1 hypothetical protein PCURB6_24970 [Paenibacillus curdlanolyticus]